MISWAEADKLARMHAPEPTVLSLYLTVPVDPAELLWLPARTSAGSPRHANPMPGRIPVPRPACRPVGGDRRGGPGPSVISTHVRRTGPGNLIAPLENRIQMVTCRSSMLRRRACTR